MHPTCSLAALSFHPQTCRLIFAGKAMNDDKMAKDYNIEVRAGGRVGRECPCVNWGLLWVASNVWARPQLAADLPPLPLHFFATVLQGGSVLHLVLALRGGAGVSQ